MQMSLIASALPLLAQTRPRPQIGLMAVVIGVGLCVLVFGALAFIFRNKD